MAHTISSISTPRGTFFYGDDLRRLHRTFWTASALWYEERARRGVPKPYEAPAFYTKQPVFPEVLRYLVCGARTRKGTPCKQRNLERNGRCKFHGGLSTGPRTPEGKARVALNGLRPKRRRQQTP